MKRYDSAARRRATRSGRERGCWVYVPAEELEKAGIDPTGTVPTAARCDGSRDCAAETHMHGCFSDDGTNCSHPEHHERPAAYVAREEYERVVAQRDALMERLEADPDRAAIATLDGLRKLLPELKAEEDEACHAILDWIGVAKDDLSLAERVRILALEVATRQGYTLEEAERLAPVV